jgi:hypothetical protein
MAGGDIEWRTRAGEPVQTVRQATRVIRDVMLGLIYRQSFLPGGESKVL